ncbi:hypothetical protein HI914_03082 [Erysiphe necator]|nr:hypothetical protein HI914_03082 [Erysiphe necator]
MRLGWSSGSLTNIVISGFLFMLCFEGRKETCSFGGRSNVLDFFSFDNVTCANVTDGQS